MKHLLLVLTVTIVTLPNLTGGQDSYDSLSESYKRGVDLALDKLNSHPTTQHHFRFYKTQHKSSSKMGFGLTFDFHNFYAKATKCEKQPKDPNLCQFRNDRPLIDCLVCYKANSEIIESEPKPYIDCVRKPVLTQEAKKEREEQCKSRGYNLGTIILLASTGEN